MDEVMGVVCGAMFGEERVNNSVGKLHKNCVAHVNRDILEVN